MEIGATGNLGIGDVQGQDLVLQSWLPRSDHTTVVARDSVLNTQNSAYFTQCIFGQGILQIDTITKFV